MESALLESRALHAIHRHSKGRNIGTKGKPTGTVVYSAVQNTFHWATKMELT